MLQILDLPTSSISNKRQVRCPPKNTTRHTVNKAQNSERKQYIVEPNHDLEPEPSTCGAEDTLEQNRKDEKHIESDSLHGVEPDIVRETWVPNHTQVESKEGDKGSVRDGPVEREEREERVDERSERWVLVEEEAAVLEGVEEGESVSNGGD